MLVSKLIVDGKQGIAEILEHLLKNPQDVQKVKDCLFVKKTKSEFAPDVALGLFLSLKLTKWQYKRCEKAPKK